MVETVHIPVPEDDWIDLSLAVGASRGHVSNSGNATLVYVQSMDKPAEDSNNGHRLIDDNFFDYTVPNPETVWIKALNSKGLASVTPNVLTGNFYLDVANGNIPGTFLVHKFGAGLLTTVPQVVTQTGAYQTPLAAQALEFVSNNINDTVAGTGAREVTVEGLDSDWNLLTQVIETDGITPVPIPTAFIRLFRWWASLTGTYATTGASSHAGDLSIRPLGGGVVWDIIPSTPLPIGQSIIGAYTIPKGKTAQLLSKQVFVDTTKTADIFFFQRPHADDVVSPFKGTRRMVEREIGLAGTLTMDFASPKGPFVGPCDIGFIGSVSQGSADASVEFELLIQDNPNA